MSSAAIVILLRTIAKMVLVAKYAVRGTTIIHIKYFSDHYNQYS